MKARIFLISLIALLSLEAQAQTARQVLDRAAQAVSSKGGATASFTIQGSKYGTASGSIAIKGNKFNARTSQAIVWYNGKTQWTYLKKTNEVNVSTPTASQQASMNPYTFINLYKSGYNMTLQKSASVYTVHLTAKDKKHAISQLYIAVNPKTNVPTSVRMLQGGKWTTITIKGFKAQNIADNRFVFSSKEFPSAEVVDLR